MSRILEFQPADEQTIVARVLLELHQAIDSQFPDVRAGSRQFTKTVLSSQAEATAIDQRPGEAMRNSQAVAASQSKASSQVLEARSSKGKDYSTNLEFSQADGANSQILATALGEASWSRWLTRSLLVTLGVGIILLAWIYLFGPPR